MNQLTALPRAFWGKLFLALIAATFWLAVPAQAQQPAPQKPAAPAAPAAPPAAPAPDQAKEQEAFALGVEAYVYGYPLVTMEMTRRVMTNVAKPAGKNAPMGQFANLKEYPDCGVQGCHRPQRRHAVLDGLAGPGPGALRPHPAGRGWPLLPDAHAGRLDQRVPGPGQADHRHQGPEVRHHRPGLEGDAASRGDGVQIPHQHGVDPGPHLLHRARRRTTRRCTRFRTSTNWCRSSAYGKPYTPPPGKVDPSIDMKTPVREQVNWDGRRRPTSSSWRRCMKDNPPAAADAPMVAKLAKIGIVPGQDFDIEQAGPGRGQGAAAASPRPAVEKIMAHFKTDGHVE